ncbi:MAG TPA: cytochrome c [Xanthobacteraceae bacterium]|nr:cytochrome c [Xanthobacteraceae bacterium]
MLRKFVIWVLIVIVLGAAAFWLLTMPTTVPATALTDHRPNLANGETMYFAGGCAGCHATLGQDDPTLLGGGRALKSPYGTFYAPNISPDRDHGIGAWSEADFVTAMVKGTAPDGRHYYPAFPYSSYQRMNHADVRDLFAYLKTLPPVNSKSRNHDLQFPFNIRRLIGGWKLLFLDGKPFQPDTSKSTQWNRGAYLVNGPGHCAECHSPRNALGAIIESQRFAGGPNLEGEGWVPNITPKRLSGWSEADIAHFLKTGMTPDGDSAGSTMMLVVRNMSRLSDADRAAMAAYLKSLPAIDGPQPTQQK